MLKIHKVNLLNTAIALLKDKKHELRMMDFVTSGADRSCYAPTLLGPVNLPIVRQCGTTTCFAGYGPLAGIAALPDERWVEYTERVFGFAADSAEWDYLFDACHADSKINCGLRLLGLLRDVESTRETIAEIKASISHATDMEIFPDYPELAKQLQISATSTRRQGQVLQALREELEKAENSTDQ